MKSIPKQLQSIPSAYRKPSQQPGRLEELIYQTHESFSYQSAQPQPLTKRALVYLPYGYDEDQSYNIVYLSHGGWSNEETLMGTPQEPDAFKHVIDHAIEKGEIDPLIIVLLTYNNQSNRDSWDYGLAIQLTQHYHRELVNDLIPAVESAYSTYAVSVSPEELKASREHRAFAGFSMGSVNTWRTFEHALDYFYYFMPMSGNVATSKSCFEQIARMGNEDFFIYAMSGDRDFAYAAFKQQVLGLEGDVFRFGDNETGGTIAFREMPDYQHDKTAADTYTYNGLRFFWKNK